jgi:hypothetical protein
MSQINVNVVAPLGYTGAQIGNNNYVTTVDENGDAVSIIAPSNYVLAIGGDNGNIVSGTIKIGRSAGVSMTTNVNGGCIAIGEGSLSSASDAGNNLAVGNAALDSVNGTTGVSNVAIGTGTGSSITSGSNNTLVGHGAGLAVVPLTTGSNNIIIGHQSYPAGANANNSVTLGNASITTLRCAVTSITSLSDARDKKDVAPIDLGLEFVKELNPVKFVWDDRNENGKHDVVDSGFIAQDLKALEDKYEAADVLKLVYDENPEKLEASYGRLIPVLVKAIQELTAKVETLENKKK